MGVPWGWWAWIRGDPPLNEMAQLPAALLEELLGVWGTAQGSPSSHYFCHLGDQYLWQSLILEQGVKESFHDWPVISRISLRREWQGREWLQFGRLSRTVGREVTCGPQWQLPEHRCEWNLNGSHLVFSFLLVDLIDRFSSTLGFAKFANKFVEFKWNSSTILEAKVIYSQPHLKSNRLHIKKDI